MLAAVDGHETHCSYKRCCPKCLQRRIAVGDEVKTQFYHRLVAFQIICEDFQLLLDVEMLEPGEDGDPGDDEVAAAIRLITRVLKDHPRCFDVLTADALYLRPSVINLLDSRWHSGHCYHHHPNSILVLWLIMFMAHAVFHCFHKCNLKSEIRRGHTAIYFARQLAASMREDRWWPSPAPG